MRCRHNVVASWPVSARSALLAATLAATAAGARASVEHDFIWNEANARMMNAQSPPDFLAAACAYHTLVRRGVRNGPLFYNLGTALLKAELYDEAVECLLRAERYQGSNADIRRNLLLALRRGDPDSEASLPWRRFPLFWHYGLSVHTRTSAAVVGFAGAWLALILHAAGRPRMRGWLLTVSLAVFALFGSSAATSWHHETRLNRKIAAWSATLTVEDSRAP